MRRLPANSSSPVTFVPLSRNPETWSDCLRRNFMSKPLCLGRQTRAGRLKLHPQEALVEPIHFFGRIEMKFYPSFAFILLNGHLCPKHLFKSVNGGLYVRVDHVPAAHVCFRRPIRIARNQHLGLPN